jgi:hypothetical protein
MGYALCTSVCIGCKRIFSYNPVRVSSIRINGTREPICQACVDLANPKRVANGLDPIVPEPDAYTACPEEELQWAEDPPMWEIVEE